MKYKYFVTLFATTGGILVFSSASHAVTLLSYQQLGNDGTREITTFNPLQIAVSDVPSPFGSPLIAQQGSDWVLTFSPTGAFRADATNAPGGSGTSTQLTAKLDFLVLFDTPFNLTASISEGGSKSTTGNGVVNLFAGGIITEADHVVPLESVGGIIPGSFGASSWTASGQLGGFQSSYSAYKFSIDNDLFADAVASVDGGTASIIKGNFSITIGTTGGGANPGVPEPASLAMLGMAVASLIFRAALGVLIGGRGCLGRIAGETTPSPQNSLQDGEMDRPPKLE